ncbi:hypothetical protein F511_15476 [Dorcoceras hygrometricum]|uniref:Uncharacterized protein n=1 Tax=Dorcoceras hygrometricum TaxID=472368 RepID=A0A2Z7B6U9_9LAMI|nr:hypothetical protein F511_15476 [Dorcoceras hygrometricum]
MVKRLATSPHDPLGITDSACKNPLVVVSVQYGPFNTYIPISSTTIGKSRVAIDPIAMHTSWRSNSDITSVTSIGYPRMRASGESSTTKHRLLHASGPHPIPPPNDPNMTINAYLCDVFVSGEIRVLGVTTLALLDSEPRLLLQPALEVLTNSARMDSPRQVGRKRISGGDARRAAAAAACGREEGRRNLGFLGVVSSVRFSLGLGLIK